MMSPRRATCLAVLAVVGAAAATAPAADACIWFYGTSVDGQPRQVGELPEHTLAALTDHREHARRASTPVPPALPPDATFEQRSDHAASLLYHGRAREAVTLLETLEQEQPGRYVIAANLGTAYELAGDDRQALRWISEGVRRDPSAHEGTEWLHVRILEAKLARAADPGWLDRSSVLGVDFGSDLPPRMPTAWPPGQDAESTGRALAYQLHERLGFVKPPDPIVADLLYDYANLIALQLTVEHALPIYDLALSYQPVRANRVHDRRGHLGRIKDKREFDAAVRVWSRVIGAVAGVIGLVVLFVWLRRRRLRRAGAPGAERPSR